MLKIEKQVTRKGGDGRCKVRRLKAAGLADDDADDPHDSGWHCGNSGESSCFGGRSSRHCQAPHWPQYNSVFLQSSDHSGSGYWP